MLQKRTVSQKFVTESSSKFQEPLPNEIRLFDVTLFRQVYLCYLIIQLGKVIFNNDCVPVTRYMGALPLLRSMTSTFKPHIKLQKRYIQLWR